MGMGSCGSCSSTQQMQMRKMDGSGGGQGQGGMRDIMQSLSTEDRATMKESLSSMSQEDRMSAVTQMKEVDAAVLSSEELPGSAAVAGSSCSLSETFAMSVSLSSISSGISFFLTIILRKKPPK